MNANPISIPPAQPEESPSFAIRSHCVCSQKSASIWASTMKGRPSPIRDTQRPCRTWSMAIQDGPGVQYISAAFWPPLLAGTSVSLSDFSRSRSRSSSLLLLVRPPLANLFLALARTALGRRRHRRNMINCHKLLMSAGSERANGKMEHHKQAGNICQLNQSSSHW